MDNQTYHARPEIGSSSLKRILTSPDHFRHGIMQASQATLALGTAIHTCTLEPNSEFIITPLFNLRSNAGKAEAIQWVNDNGGDIDGDVSDASGIRAAIDTVPNAILAADYDVARYVAESVWDSTRAAQLLTGAIIEQSYFDHGLKARPDATNAEWLIDLKSTVDPSAHAFGSQCEKLKYGFSLAHYEHVLAHQADAILTDTWAWICVATKPDRERNGRPIYQVEVYEADVDLTTNSRGQFLRALDILRVCHSTDTWPGPTESATATRLRRPGWATNQYGDDL